MLFFLLWFFSESSLADQTHYKDGICPHIAPTLKLQVKDGRHWYRSPVNFKKDIQAKNSNGSANVVIEIPAGCNDKWEVNANGQLEWDMKNGKPRVVRHLPYPANYGMIPGTHFKKAIGGDGDPLDVLVLNSSIARGTVIPVRLLGVMHTLDKGEKDDKLIAIPAQSRPGNRYWQKSGLSQGIKDQLALWFRNYKGANKIEIKGWGTAEQAQDLLDKTLIR